MSHKESLVTTAILGTSQQADIDLICSDLLADYLGQVHSEKEKLGRERLFLHIAALVWLYERGGQNWTKFDGELPRPAGAEDKPAVSVQARTVLKLLLESQQDLVPEWLELANKVGKRVPDDLLCDLLELGARNESLRAAMKSCLGARADWLAQCNPQWSYASKLETVSDSDQEELQKAWDFGSIDQRVAALGSVRAQDAGKGLALLRSTWSSDSAEDRARFLSCLENGLSMNDEDFLETEALDDRRKEVRKKAQDLLLKLSESRLSNRAWKIFLESVSIQVAKEGGNFLSKFLPGSKKVARELQVQLPEACDKAMTRDGIASKSSDFQLGEKQWWLCQIIGYLHPRKILDHFQVNEQEMIELITVSEYMLVFRKGLEESCRRHSDADMAITLMLQTTPDNAEGLFAVLAANEQERVLTGMLESRSFLMVKQTESYYDSQAVSLLLKMNHKWSADFSRIVLKSIRTHMTQKNNFIFLEHIMRHIGRHMDTGVWSGVAETWVSSVMDPALEKMISTLSLRSEIRQSLSL